MNLTDKQKEILESTNLPLLLLLESEEINSDDEALPDEEPPSEEEVSEQQEEEMEQPPTEEEAFGFEIGAAEDKFLQFTLYDKLVALSGKIEILLDSIKNSKSDNEIIDKLEHYQQYLNVLNELIFSMSTTTVYKILGQIDLELVDLLTEYNNKLEKEKETNDNS